MYKPQWYADYEKFREQPYNPRELTPDDIRTLMALQWYKNFGEKVPLDTRDYNYGAALDAGVRPEINPYDNKYHWPDAVPGHPAVSMAGAGIGDDARTDEQRWRDYYYGRQEPVSGEMLKSPIHPTAWMEFFMRQTGKDPSLYSIEDALKYPAR